jgi:hypothetical protein
VTQPATIELDAGFPAQDYVVIEGERSPGKCTVLGFTSPRGWDQRKGYAQSGATLVPTGDELGSGELLFEFWDEQQMPAWYAFAAKYFDKSVRLVPGSNQPRALGISHPVLAAPPMRVTAVVVSDATALSKDELGLWSCRIALIQYRKPKPALAAPSGAIPPAQTAQPTAQDAADREMAEKLAIFQGLAK